VPEPDPHQRAAAEALVASANKETAEIPPLGDDTDREAVERDLLLVRTLFGRVTLGAPVAAAASSRTFRVVADHGALDLAVSIDADDRLLTATWTPRPVSPPPSDVR
jgi:hypothetical protein